MAGRLILVLLAATAVIARPALAAPAPRAALPGPVSPAGHGMVSVPLEGEDQAIRVRPGNVETQSSRVSRVDLYPSYSWPMERALHDGLVIVNYVDDDATAATHDYMGGTWAYDTHRGTDIALDDFRAMDRGYRIRAAAPGTVTYAVWSNLRDRNCAVPDNPTLNYIEVANGDGTYTYYYHLRANSMTVNVGESVQRGQILGMAGSSGYSYGPHLHFEAADWLSGPYRHRDPWGGPNNPDPGLWFDQKPYAGAEHIAVYDLGVTTQAAAGGNLANVDYCTTFAERVSQPAVLGIHEPYLPIWIQMQALAGDSYRVEIRRPNASLYAWVDYTLSSEMRGGLHYWYWFWDGYVTGADYGTWTASILVGSTVVRQVGFVVGPSTIFGPRFTPRCGRSFRINGAAQKDTLHHSPLGGSVTYSLLGGPDFVTLSDSILTVGAVSSQPTRSLYFQVLATDAAARTDTAWYHVVDPSKPQELVTGVGDPVFGAALELAPAFPNPSREGTALRLALGRRGRVGLAIHDAAGRRVATLLDQVRGPGGETWVWDGRDDAGRRVPAGIYFARLSTDQGLRVRRFARLE